MRGVTTFLLNALRLNSTGNPADPQFEHRSRNKSIPFLLSETGNQYLHSRAILEKNSEQTSTNLERVATTDVLSYSQLSQETIFTSIQSNNASPLPVNVSLVSLIFRNRCVGLFSESFRSSLFSSWIGFDVIVTNPHRTVRSMVNAKSVESLFTIEIRVDSLIDLSLRSIHFDTTIDESLRSLR